MRPQTSRVDSLKRWRRHRLISTLVPQLHIVSRLVPEVAVEELVEVAGSPLVRERLGSVAAVANTDMDLVPLLMLWLSEIQLLKAQRPSPVVSNTGQRGIGLRFYLFQCLELQLAYVSRHHGTLQFLLLLDHARQDRLQVACIGRRDLPQMLHRCI